MEFFRAPQRHPHIVIFSINGCCIEIVEELHYKNVLRISMDKHRQHKKVFSIFCYFMNILIAFHYTNVLAICMKKDC
jgi:hypothetical protein